MPRIEDNPTIMTDGHINGYYTSGVTKKDVDMIPIFFGRGLIFLPVTLIGIIILYPVLLLIGLWTLLQEMWLPFKWKWF